LSQHYILPEATCYPACACKLFADQAAALYPGLPLLAMANIVSSLKAEATYKMLIKLHLSKDPKHSTGDWNTSDLDHVVKCHEKFLEGVALTGSRINETVLSKCLYQHFNCSPQQCKDFARKMAQALSWCRSKCKGGRFSSGKKTSPHASRIRGAILGCQSEWSWSRTESPTDLEAPIDLVEPDSPPKLEDDGGDDALVALRNLQEAFGEGPISTTACSSRKVLDPPSPMSIASSSCVGSPVGKPGGAAEVPVTIKVPGFSECVGMVPWAS
jgi:hypothetical protein